MSDSQGAAWCVLLAGGIGSRLAPLSTPERPKQVLPILPDGRSPLRATLDRAGPLFGERVLVVTGQPMEAAVRACLPELDPGAFLIEPEGRNTLPALVWASAEVARRGGTRLVSNHADHRVDDEPAFREVVRQALAQTGGPDLVLVGLRPTWANPGLGWIVPGEPLGGGARRIARFVEKPPEPEAQRLLDAGALWNLGLFAWSIAAFERAIGHRPDLVEPYRRLVEGDPVAEVYGQLPRISVDHGLIEATAQLRAVGASFDWSDLGTPESIRW